MITAIESGDESRVSEYIAQKYVVNEINGDGRIPLHVAVSNGGGKIARLLIDAGANPNSQDSAGYSALHLAACKNDPDLVNMLLKAGAEINAMDSMGNTALHMTVQLGLRKAVLSLVAAGADINVPNSFGSTPMSLAPRALRETIRRLANDNTKSAEERGP